MTIFLVTITALLFILRIKGMSKMLSKKKYLNKIQEGIEKNKISFENAKSEEMIKYIKVFALACVGFLECFMAIYYIVLGTKIGILYFTILTVLQLLTIIETCRRQLNMKAFSFNIEDYKFYRWYFLFNIMLDLVYYPLAIYLLLK